MRMHDALMRVVDIVRLMFETLFNQDELCNCACRKSSSASSSSSSSSRSSSTNAPNRKKRGTMFNRVLALKRA